VKRVFAPYAFSYSFFTPWPSSPSIFFSDKTPGNCFSAVFIPPLLVRSLPLLSLRIGSRLSPGRPKQTQILATCRAGVSEQTSCANRILFFCDDSSGAGPFLARFGFFFCESDFPFGGIHFPFFLRTFGVLMAPFGFLLGPPPGSLSPPPPPFRSLTFTIFLLFPPFFLTKLLVTDRFFFFEPDTVLCHCFSANVIDHFNGLVFPFQGLFLEGEDSPLCLVFYLPPSPAPPRSAWVF